MASSKLLFLLLFSAAVSSINAATDKPPIVLFADWMEQKKPGKAGLAYYPAAEVKDVCMREHKVDGCSCYGRRGEKDCCFEGNIESEMTCCNGPEAKYVDKITEDVLSTGKCSYTMSYLEEQVQINEHDKSVMKVGTFSGICTMNKDSSVCGEPACDGMSVTVQGDILRATSVAFEGRGVTPIRHEKCEKLFKGDCKSMGAADSKKVQAAAYAYSSRPHYSEQKYESNKYETKYGPSYGEPHYPKYEDKHEDKYQKHADKYDSYKKDEPKYGYEQKDGDYHKKSDDKYSAYHKEESKYGYETKGDDYYKKPEYKSEDKYDSTDSYKEEHDKYYEPKHDDKYEVEEKYEERPSYDSYEDKKKYYLGVGEVFMGTFYTVNRIHDTRHATGIYQAVLVDEIKDEALEHAPEGAYVARPNEVYFRFVKGGAAESYQA